MDLILLEDDYANGSDIESGLKKPIKEKLYVAVGKELKQNESLLCWAIQNSGGRFISIIHVHQPDNFIPDLGKKNHWSSLEEHEVEAYRLIEKKFMLKKLDEYLQFCHDFGVQAEKLYIEMETVEKGILQLIAQYSIEKLVMGAADDSCYHTNMMEPMSKKAVSVQLHAPAKCHIWFICKGNLIHQRPSLASPSHMNRESTANHLQLRTGPFLEGNHYHHTSHRVAQEDLYAEAVKKRNELEEELKKIKHERDELRKRLQDARDNNLVLEAKVANYEQVVKELEEGIISNLEMLQVCEQERDGLKTERDNVLKTAEELLNQSAESSSQTIAPKFFATFTSAEIKIATNDYDPSLQILEGEIGSIYEGELSHMQVTIKILRPNGMEGPQEFHQEVEILTKFRHPNVASLIGVCPEDFTIVYEHLAHGSLQDRLYSAGDAPLLWKSRIRIATELCCALIFLHSRGVIHGFLKPVSIFLDSNFSCKITDFGFSRIIHHDENLLSTELECIPSYSEDVYSFGLILLELLTRKQVHHMINELKDALDENIFDSYLDTSAGDWPFVQADQLARVALRCCAEDARDRPDLELEVWRILDPMNTSCGGSTSYHLGNDEHRQVPSYFMCPIFQEVMKDPHIAADGYTYEAEALQEWFDTGHDTSPMTNLPLEHTDLIPNHALRSAIQEWRQ